MRRAGYAVLLAALAFAGAEAAAYAGLAALRRFRKLEYPAAPSTLTEAQRHSIRQMLREDPGGYLRFDAELGWVLKPASKFRIYRSSAQALRGRRIYAARPPKGVLRVATFGDSFVHGNEVGDEDTFQARLEALDPRIEAPNFGVQGYGPDQAYLYYLRREREFHPRVVVIGFIPENSRRLLSSFRGFYNAGRIDLGKPRFELQGDRLVLIKNPTTEDDLRRLSAGDGRRLSELWAADYYGAGGIAVGPWDALALVRLGKLLARERGRRADFDPRSRQFRLTVAVFKAFAAAVEDRGAVPVVVIFPLAGDVQRRNRGEAPVYDGLARRLRREGLRVIDMMDIHPKTSGYAPVKRLVPRHYSAEGNAAIARRLRDFLVEEGLLDGFSSR